MKIERTKNASRNILFGGILKIYQIILPFVMRTAILYLLGVEYLGLNSLFTSILQVLNLVELGVGSAMVFSMYQPIVEDDTDKICALMKLYKVYYRVIGLLVLVLGIVLVPFVPKLINGTVPGDLNVYILYLLNLFATVLSYWLFAYKGSILQAFQRNDLISKVTILIDTCKYLLQLGVLAIFHNYYYYVIVILASQVAVNIITAIIADKYYPKFKANGKLEKSEIKVINGRIRDLFTSKIGAVVVNSADSIVVSAFLGLTMLAIYQNYYFIISSVIGIISIIFISCTAGIGNSIIVETQEKNFRDLKKITFLIMWIVGVCSCCLLSMFQPFIEIWAGKENMLGFGAVICFCAYFVVYEINQIWIFYKDAAGIWHEDRFRPLVTALVNLVMNLITVNYIGIYGVILSTVLSTLLIGMPWLLNNLFTVLFDKKYLKGYLKKLIFYIVTVIVVNFITFLLSSVISTNVILKLLIC